MHLKYPQTKKCIWVAPLPKLASFPGLPGGKISFTTKLVESAAISTMVESAPISTMVELATISTMVETATQSTMVEAAAMGAIFKKVYCVSPWNIESQDFQLMLILKF